MDIFHFDLIQFITNIGLWGVFLVVFAESSIVFFLPGDSLLFVAGLLATQRLFSVWSLISGVFVSAIVGNSFGYWLGHKFGRRLFSGNNKLFKKEHIEKTESYYAKYGAQTIILARFIPFIRTFAPIIAGIGKMNYSQFLLYNVLGGFLWSFGLCLSGYYLGKAIPDIDKFILPIVGLIVFISIIPPFLNYLKSRKPTD